MSIISLTQDIINNDLKCPEGKTHIELCDAEQRGLYVEVRRAAPGKGTYYFSYKASGKRSHRRLGTTEDTTLDQARAKARALRSEVTSGLLTPPFSSAKPGLSVDDFFEKHYLPFVRPRKRSWKRDQELYRLRIKPALGPKRLADVTRQEVQGLQAAILAEGLAPATADHHVKLIRQALNIAVDWGMLEKNPAAGVKLFRVDNKVENYLDDAQFARLLHVLRTDENRTVCWIASFLLCTGCRLNEALQATWSQIDRDTRVWRIPASNSKSKRIRSVPLNDSALEVLAQLDTEGQFDHLFVNRRTGLPYGTIMKVWDRLRNTAGVPHLRLHDLRHMYASLLVNSGRTLYEVQQILGHSDPSVTQRYAHLSTKSLLDAANSASIAIRGASTSQAPKGGATTC